MRYLDNVLIASVSVISEGKVSVFLNSVLIFRHVPVASCFRFPSFRKDGFLSHASGFVFYFFLPLSYKCNMIASRQRRERIETGIHFHSLPTDDNRKCGTNVVDIWMGILLSIVFA